MSTHQIVKLHISTYKGELVGIYEYCRGFFSLPFTSYTTAYHELMKARGNEALNISDDEWKFLLEKTKTKHSSLPEKQNEEQKKIEEELRKEYCDCKNQDVLLKTIFDIDIDDPKIFDN